MYKLKISAIAGLFAVLGTMATAQGWTLNADASRIAFGSVKKDTVGEVHSFETISGTVSAQGAVAVEIDLSSVETLIDIRNERMVEFVFKNSPKAMINAQVDMASVSALAPGESAVVDATGTVALSGSMLELDTEMFVMRISDGQVMATTNDMIMLSLADMGLTDGIDKLMELANLPGITRVSPVTLRLVFDLNKQKAEAAPAATATVTQVALAGDASKGKKVFRKCKACHSLKEGKNGVGPTLHGVIGRPAAAVEGFKYSKAIAGLDVNWTPAELAAYLANPKKYAPGTTMGFRGLKKEADIQNLMAYLAENG